MNNDHLPIDSNGFPFSMPEFRLKPDEYCKIISEINQVFDVHYKGKGIAAHTSFGMDGRSYIYWFENHGFNNYNIFMRVIDNH